MHSVPSRLYTALMAGLVVFLLCVLLVAVLDGGSAAQDAYTSRRAAFAWPQVPELTGEINVNTADAQALTQLPGVGEVLARRILAERAQNGPFHFPGELLAVSGIGEKKLQVLLPHIRLDDPPR